MILNFSKNRTFLGRWEKCLIFVAQTIKKCVLSETRGPIPFKADTDLKTNLIRRYSDGKESRNSDHPDKQPRACRFVKRHTFATRRLILGSKSSAK